MWDVKGRKKIGGLKPLEEKVEEVYRAKDEWADMLVAANWQDLMQAGEKARWTQPKYHEALWRSGVNPAAFGVLDTCKFCHQFIVSMGPKQACWIDDERKDNCGGVTTPPQFHTPVGLAKEAAKDKRFGAVCRGCGELISNSSKQHHDLEGNCW